MRSLLKSALATAGLCLALGGCAEFDSINVKRPLDDNSSMVFIDAKQRAVFTSIRPVQENGPNGSYIQSYRAFCSEPSPDVFSVFAQALSAAGSGSGDSTTIKAALQAAFSSSEAGSTIPRTQTVNMLREMMFRTCERYISGAMTPLDFSIQAVRDQRVMVSILAIEQLTGAVAPHAVALTANGSASAGQNSSEALVRLDDAWKSLQAANLTLQQKQDALKALDAPPTDGTTSPGTCADIAKAVKADATKGTAGTPTGDKNTKCVAAQQAVNDADASQKSAQEHWDKLDAASSNGGTPLTASTSGEILAGGGNGGLDRAPPESVEAVANAVRDIVSDTFDQSEMELLCVKTLEATVPRGDQVIDACVKLLQTSIELKAAKQDKERAETEQLTRQLMQRTHDDIIVFTKNTFEKFWARIASKDNPNAVNSSALKIIVDALIATRTSWPAKTLGALQALEGATDKADALARFNAVNRPQQRFLAGP